MILRVFIFSKNKAFRESQFFVIYAADLIVGIYMSLSEILIGRLFIYITPLCPIIGPYFFTPSIFLKIYFTLSHYAQGFKTISQVLLSLNRMTSVVFPVTCYKSWKNIQTPSMIVLFVMPVGVIWNIIISRVYVNPSSGGFSVNYIKKVEWASLSKLHLAYFIFSLTMIIIFSGITLYGLFVMKTRMKKAETSITVATMVISVEFSSLAMFQVDPYRSEQEN
ncbi:hypothetical protein B9Z55_010108 [Caenorhabditis nigoni]|nr:hypothetical protein B9Z55_010108 [Caenorhabditis nigoni]